MELCALDSFFTHGTVRLRRNSAAAFVRLEPAPVNAYSAKKVETAQTLAMAKAGLRLNPGAGSHRAARRFLILAIAFFVAVVALVFAFALGIACAGGLDRFPAGASTRSRPAVQDYGPGKMQRILRPYRRTKLLG